MCGRDSLNPPVNTVRKCGITAASKVLCALMDWPSTTNCMSNMDSAALSCCQQLKTLSPWDSVAEGGTSTVEYRYSWAPAPTRSFLYGKRNDRASNHLPSGLSYLRSNTSSDAECHVQASFEGLSTLSHIFVAECSASTSTRLSAWGINASSVSQISRSKSEWPS